MLSNPIDPEKTFLTIDNGTQVPENQSIEDGQLEIDIKYVNCTLSDLGLDAPFPFVEQPCSPSTLYRTRSAVTTLIRLLSARKRDEAYRNDTDERFKKLEEEIEVGRQTLERCFSRLQASEAELRMVQEESRCRAVRLSEMENILKLTSDECSRLRNAFLTKERQFTVSLFLYLL